MKVLLDENITQKSIKILEKYGHNVIHVLDRLEPGKSDDDVFALALLEKRALITLNGKHFIVFIPPQTDLVLHYGLVWLRGFQVTNKSYEEIMNMLGEFLLNKGNDIANTYYAMKRKDNSYEIIQRFPKSSKMLVQL